MGLIGNFVRFLVSLAIFVGVLILGILFTPQLGGFFSSLPGTVKLNFGNGTVEIPVLASIVASVAASLLINLIALPFRRSNDLSRSNSV